jgi:hypothetical protein
MMLELASNGLVRLLEVRSMSSSENSEFLLQPGTEPWYQFSKLMKPWLNGKRRKMRECRQNVMNNSRKSKIEKTPTTRPRLR